MKRFLLSALLLLAFAVPALAATYTYDNNEADNDASNVANWAPSHDTLPVDGDTIDIAVGVSTDPTTPISGGGGGGGDTFHFTLTTGNTDRLDLDAFIDRTGGTPDLIGNVQLSGGESDLSCGGDIGGTLILDAVSGTYLFMSENCAVTGKITVGAGASLSSGNTLMANGGVDLGGALLIQGISSVVDCASPINCTGDCEINWGSGDGDILGGLDANGHTVTHTDTASGNSLTCDQAGDLELGGDATGLQVNTAAGCDQTLQDDMNIYGFDLTGGALTVSNKTITVGAGGFADTGGTCTARELNIVCSATTAVAAWPTVGDILKSLTVNVGVTATTSGIIYVNKVVNNGTIAVTGNQRFFVYQPDANDFWSGSGTVTGTSNDAGFSINASRSNAALIDWATAPMMIAGAGTANILTASGGLTCGNLLVRGPDTATRWIGLTIGAGAQLNCANLTLGADAHRSGKLVLSDGGAVITGAISQPATTSSVAAITFGGQVNLGGNYTGTGITPTWTAASTSTSIVATGNITFNGAEVAGANGGAGCDLFTNGKTVTWQNINNSTAANKVRIWGGGTVNGNNTNVTAHSGVPSGMGRMGMGN